MNTQIREKVTWPGQFNRYEYQVFDLNTTWNDVAGNYIFAKRVQGGWTALYVGQTNSFAKRFQSHEKWACARNRGATHIHAHVTTSEAQRMAEEADIVARCQPPCNEQLR